MCGFLGSITKSEISINELELCNQRIICRGPDEKKIINNKQYLSNPLFHNFVFNRLSIIDLSSNASQPMFSEKFNTLIMFNGEIYNHRELRKELENSGIKFNSSHSDTETLLMGLSSIGIDFIKKINGQFSIFFYDISKKCFYLIRDRAGQKPLYYSKTSQGVYFSSDLQSVKNLSKSYELDSKQISNYLNFGSSLTPDSFFANIKNIKPGEYLKFSFENQDFKITDNKYWDLQSYIDDKKFSEEEFIELFEDSVNLRLESDVPVSNFLSGGLDSTAVVKAVSKNKRQLNTFSVITNSKKYNESEYIDQVVKKYDTNHTYREISLDIKLETIKSIILKYDDIIYDPSLIPTYILSNNISEDFKVALSGDGGDELLSGYQHYANFHKNKNLNSQIVDLLFSAYPKFFGTGNNILKFSKDWKTAYASFYEDKKLMKILNIKNYSSFNEIYLTSIEKSWKSLMLVDYKFFLNEMMLKKIDRSSMLNSLEIRSPFLDYRLAEYVMGHKSFSSGEQFTAKKIIKNYLLKDNFNHEFLDRKKMGFSIDIKSIVASNRYEIFETILNSSLNNLLDLRNIKKLNLVNSRINSTRLWKLYVLSLFLDNIGTIKVD